MDVPLGSVTALIFCRSGCGFLVACSVDLIVVSFEVFCALVGCITSSGVKRLSVCRGAGSGGCCRPVGEVAIGLSGSGCELDVDVDGSRGGGVARCCFVAGSTTMSSVTFVCWPKSCVDRLFSDDCSCVSNSVANDGLYVFRRGAQGVPETLLNSTRSYLKSGCSLRTVRTFCTPAFVAT